jgi:hypothetical protein
LNFFTAQIFARLNFPVQQSIEFVENTLTRTR